MKVRTVAAFAIGPIGGAVLSAVTVPALAWFFSPADVGRFFLLQTTVGLLVAVAFLGLDQAYVREFHETENKASLLRATSLPGLLLFVPLAVVIAFFGESIAGLIFGEQKVAYAWVMLACAFFAFVSRQMSLILRMRESALAFSMIQLLPKAAFLLLIGSIAATPLPESFVALQVSLLISSALVSIFYLSTTAKEWIPALRIRLERARLSVLLKFGLPLMLASIAYWALASTSVYVLRAFSSFEEIGIYSVSTSVAGVAVVVQSIFSVVWAPVVYRWSASGADMGSVGRVARQAVVVIALVFVLCGLLSWLLQYALPAAYVEVQFLVLASIVQPLLYTLAEITGIGINLTRRTASALWSTLAAFATALVLNAALVPAYGASGAVAANALSFVVFFVLRTEISAAIWKPFPRWKMYSVVILCTSTAILTALYGPVMGLWASFVWFAVAACTGLILRTDIVDLSKVLFQRRS